MLRSGTYGINSKASAAQGTVGSCAFTHYYFCDQSGVAVSRLKHKERSETSSKLRADWAHLLQDNHVS